MSVWLLKSVNRFQGITLAELLIALAILGVIAVFIIPKILSAQQNGAYNAAAKEALGAVSATWTRMKADGSGTIASFPIDILKEMNYVTVDTTSSIDNFYANSTPTSSCSANPCYRLHNGGVLQAASAGTMRGAETTNAVFFLFDPDGQADNSTTGPAKSLKFALYYSGQITDRDHILPGTVANSSVYVQGVGTTPPWFSW